MAVLALTMVIAIAIDTTMTTDIIVGEPIEADMARDTRVLLAIIITVVAFAARAGSPCKTAYVSRIGVTEIHRTSSSAL